MTQKIRNKPSESNCESLYKAIMLKRKINLKLLSIINKRKISEGKTLLTGIILEHSLKATKLITYFAGQ